MKFIRNIIKRCREYIELKASYDYWGGMHFIFGEGRSSLYTTDVNEAPTCDFDVFYDPKEKLYYLGMETALWFETKVEWINWLDRCLLIFTSYMKDNGLSTEQEYALFF